jgi:hypothetical protein
MKNGIARDNTIVSKQYSGRHSQVFADFTLTSLKSILFLIVTPENCCFQQVPRLRVFLLSCVITHKSRNYIIFTYVCVYLERIDGAFVVCKTDLLRSSRYSTRTRRLTYSFRCVAIVVRTEICSVI